MVGDGARKAMGTPARRPRVGAEGRGLHSTVDLALNIDAPEKKASASTAVQTIVRLSATTSLLGRGYRRMHNARECTSMTSRELHIKDWTISEPTYCVSLSSYSASEYTSGRQACTLRSRDQKMAMASTR